jgi:hypothetical protein
MSVNKFKIAFDSRDQEINLRFNSDWEYNGLDDGYSVYEAGAIERSINPPVDFEVSRFSNDFYLEDGEQKTEINYEFNFYNQINSTYYSSYVQSNLFTPQECYYNSNSFSKSFFKLDFYDFSASTEQKNYITIILPTQQGLTQSALIGNNSVNIKKPVFPLDFIGDKEGFFIYWLKNRDYLNIDTFYMSAKFFDAKNGRFVRLINKQLTNITNFNPDEYFYYKVKLDYPTQTYRVYDYWTQNRVGDSLTPIKWFEYINP